jgi:hypothetical protein
MKRSNSLREIIAPGATWGVRSEIIAPGYTKGNQYVFNKKSYNQLKTFCCTTQRVAQHPRILGHARKKKPTCMDLFLT